MTYTLKSRNKGFKLALNSTKAEKQWIQAMALKRYAEDVLTEEIQASISDFEIWCNREFIEKFGEYLEWKCGVLPNIRMIKVMKLNIAR